MRAVGYRVDRDLEDLLRRLGGPSKVARKAVAEGLAVDPTPKRFSTAGRSVGSKTAHLPPEMFDLIPEPRLPFVSWAVERYLRREHPEQIETPSSPGPVPGEATSREPEEAPCPEDPEQEEAPSSPDHEPDDGQTNRAQRRIDPGKIKSAMSHRMVQSATWLSAHLTYEPWYAVTETKFQQLEAQRQRLDRQIHQPTAESEWPRVRDRWEWLTTRRCPDCQGPVIVLGRVTDVSRAYCRSCRRVLVESQRQN